MAASRPKMRPEHARSSPAVDERLFCWSQRHLFRLAVLPGAEMRQPAVRSQLGGFQVVAANLVRLMRVRPDADAISAALSIERHRLGARIRRFQSMMQARRIDLQSDLFVYHPVKNVIDIRGMHSHRIGSPRPDSPAVGIL